MMLQSVRGLCEESRYYIPRSLIQNVCLDYKLYVQQELWLY